MSIKNIIVLFDESGAPSISKNQRSDWFIGVGVAYHKFDEQNIFTTCDADFGLSKIKPLKNDRISNSRVKKMATTISDLPLSVYVSAINTANSTFRSIIVEYESVCAEARRNRQIRKRPIPQIIHSHVLDHCLFNLITGYLEKDTKDVAFKIFIDDWSIPKNDVDISLGHRAKSLSLKISNICRKFSMGSLISIAPLKLMNKDSNRKRFIDGMASMFNRIYLNQNDNKYSIDVIEMLKKYSYAQFDDTTQYSINIMKNVMSKAPDKQLCALHG